MFRFKAFFFFSFLFFFFLPWNSAYTTSFDIKPVVVFISTRTPITFLTLTNTSDETIRFQVKLYAWDQNKEGKMLLSPSEDLVFFPRLLSLAPGEKRLIRIGTESPLAAIEKTYRFLVSELPESTQVSENQVKMLMAFSVPVFLTPFQQIIEATIQEIKISQGIFSFVIKNNGNTHFQAQSIHVIAYGEEGKEIFQKQMSGWYILPQEFQIYQIKIPLQDCRKIKEFSIHVKTQEIKIEGSGEMKTIFKDLNKLFKMPMSACGS